MNKRNESRSTQGEMATSNGNHNDQMATGDSVIQIGTINGGAVNLLPGRSPQLANEPSWTWPDTRREEMLAMHRALSSLFSEEELRDLVFELAIAYDDLPGAARKDKARELVAFCRRHGRLAELKLAILRHRPKAL